MSVDAVVRCENLVHVFGTPGNEVAALRGVDLTVLPGETVALLGPSGAGKSTLLWHLAGLLRPTAGTVDVNGHRLAGMSASELAAFRAREIGVVLQGAGRNLLPYASAVDNITHVRRALPRTARSKRVRAMELLDAVGLSNVAHRASGRLSGGEQQRLALAVALANGPALLLADEPTSQLDPAAAVSAVELIRRANEEFDTAVVVVTHDPAVGAALRRTVTIRDGRVGAEGRAGEDYVVVGRDGSVQLPPELLETFPPGTLARAVRTERGVELRKLVDDVEGDDL
jgi:ABC-type lipoprotein export system ATPase subunit